MDVISVLLARPGLDAIFLTVSWDRAAHIAGSVSYAFDIFVQYAYANSE